MYVKEIKNGFWFICFNGRPIYVEVYGLRSNYEEIYGYFVNAHKEGVLK